MFIWIRKKASIKPHSGFRIELGKPTMVAKQIIGKLAN